MIHTDPRSKTSLPNRRQGSNTLLPPFPIPGRTRRRDSQSIVTENLMSLSLAQLPLLPQLPKRVIFE
jgi:hypothetical protein